jgi:hypothetical protein
VEKTDWLDLPTSPAGAAEPQKVPPAAAPPPADDAWLNLEDPNAGKVTRAFDSLVHACMRGTDRVMATDGRFLAYRPFNRQFDKETNPRTKERMNMFRAAGFYKHLGTYDEVEVYELQPGNPYYHEANKRYVVGTNYSKDIDTVARLALERKWSEYHDFLGGMATALKTGRDALFAKSVWDDTLTHILVRIKQLGGPESPSEREINEGFVGVRRARGISGRGTAIALPPANSLVQVGFTKK